VQTKQHTSSLKDDPYLYLGTAASGDLEAIRMLVRLGKRIAIEEGDIAATIESLVFARMAAVRGTSDDMKQLLKLLSLADAIVAHDPVWSGYRMQLQDEMRDTSSALEVMRSGDA